MGSTKKVKKAGRFGAKFGIGIRRRWLKVAEKQQKRYDCPQCGFKKVKRTASGIFECKKCGMKFAGGAYFPTTLTGSIVKKMVEQKQFLPAVTELIAATEKAKGIAVEEPTEEKEEGSKEKEKPKHKKEEHKKEQLKEKEDD